MLEALRHRGADSTGVTVGGQKTDGDLIVRFFVDEDRDEESAIVEVGEVVMREGGVIKARRTEGRHLRLVLDYKGSLATLARALVKLEGVNLHSMGAHSEVVKDVGDARALDTKHGIGMLKGTHGIGHVRLATESRVDVNHSHPFWAYPFPDITLVHNGQLTNYWKTRRVMEEKGHKFQTDNDSELIAVYIADKLSKGSKLEDTLYQSLEDLDGTYTYVVSTADSIGFAKERLSAKPLLYMETRDVVAISSEEVALRKVFPEEIDRVEPQANEVMTWKVPLPLLVSA